MFMIQFGWRLVTFIILAISFLAPLAIKNVKSKVLYSIIVFGLVLSGILSIHFATNDIVNLNNIEYVYGMGWQREYLPVQVEENMEYFNSRSEEVIANNELSKTTILDNQVPYLKFTVESETETEIELPRIFYFGYTLTDEEGKTYDLWENDHGFLASKVSSGTYTLKYTGSLPYRICLYISLGTVFIIIVYYSTKKIKKNKIQEN